MQIEFNEPVPAVQPGTVAASERRRAFNRSRKRRGADTQTIVAAAWREDGWPYAESTGAGRDGADLTGTPGVAIEVKARRGLDLNDWLGQAIRQAGAGEIPVLIVRLDGTGPSSVDGWPAIVPHGVLRALLRAAGYGEPLHQPEV